MNIKQIAITGAIAIATAAALPSAGVAAGNPTKTVSYTVTVRKGVDNGLEQPYNSQGYSCVPVMDGAMNVSNAHFTCRLRGADVPTTVRLTFTAPYNPPTGP